jgi:uncharacterized protein
VDDGAFARDEAKAAANAVRHGVTFAAARGVFADPFALEWRDERVDYGEDRYIVIGMAAGRLLYVAYTLRGDTIRIISARAAEPYERRRYHDDNA